MFDKRDLIKAFSLRFTKLVGNAKSDINNEIKIRLIDHIVALEIILNEIIRNRKLTTCKKGIHCLIQC